MSCERHLCWLLLVNGYLMASVCTGPSGSQDHGVLYWHLQFQKDAHDRPLYGHYAHCAYWMHTKCFGVCLYGTKVFFAQKCTHFWGLCHGRKLMKLTCEKIWKCVSSDKLYFSMNPAWSTDQYTAKTHSDLMREEQSGELHILSVLYSLEVSRPFHYISAYFN